MKIFQGLKAVNFNNAHDSYLTLALDFCLYDLCQNSDNTINNSGLIFFSYPKINYNYYKNVK